MRRVVVVLAAVTLAIACWPATAGDWPQILGPARNGLAQQERLASSWTGEPPTLWQRPVGSGLAGVAVSGDRVVLFHRVGGEEIVEGIAARTGKSLWKHSYPCSYAGGINPDNGPRCVPVIAGDAVYTHGALGMLSCVGLADGKPRWSRDTQVDYGAQSGPHEGYFGAGSSPIAEGKLLLLNVGGEGESGLVAFDLASGETVWKATTEGASYSSPVAATIDGVRHVIFVTRLNCVSVDPLTGKVRFRLQFGQRGPTVNGANPVVHENILFLSASYGIGAVAAKLTKNGADSLWAAGDVMSSQYTTCVVHEGVFYGVDGREDVGSARLRAFDPASGNIHWTHEDLGMATLIAADGKLIITKTNGELILAEANPKAYRQLASARIFRTTTRPLPALAQGKLYVRDTETLKCLDLGIKK